MKYTPPYAPKGYRSNVNVSPHSKRSGSTQMSNLPNQNYKRNGGKAKGLLKVFLFVFILIGANTLYQHYANKTKTEASSKRSSLIQSKGKDENFIEAKPKELSTDKVIEISQELARRISNHAHLPPSRGVNWAWIEENKATNQKAMDELLEKLSIEIGSSEALGILRTIRENRVAISQISQLTQSSDPSIARNANEKVEELKAEINLLTAKLTEAYSKEGLSLSEAQIQSLTKSPHGEEASYLINGFQNIQIVCLEMENRLRKFPSEEMAKKYYGTYHVLLLALDRIQKNAIDRIYYLHLPETRWVFEEASAAKRKALDMLKYPESSNNLSQNQKRALQFNIQSCDRTIAKAMSTENKLRQSLDSLERSNDKLRHSIDAAENSHMTMLLHTEISRIGQDHIQEIEQLKDITLPDMIAADFSDEDDPWLSPMNPNPITP
jgi:hypothetical protein